MAYSRDWVRHNPEILKELRDIYPNWFSNRSTKHVENVLQSAGEGKNFNVNQFTSVKYKGGNIRISHLIIDYLQ